MHNRMSGGYDAQVIVVGGGSAGAAAALHCARRGLETLVLERRPFARAGAAWVNGVHERAFSEGEIARPVAPELRAAAHRVHLVAGWGPNKAVIEGAGVLDVDMRRLVWRLRDEAARQGAALLDEIRVTAITPGEVHANGEVYRAPIIVDASGLGGLFKRDKPKPSEICAAAQGVYRVRYHSAAEAFFAAHGAAVGDALIFTAVAGGYSILNVRLEGDEVSVLTGSLPALGHASGRALRDDFVFRERAWIGEMVFGGHAPIPLHRPHRKLAFFEGTGPSGPRAVVRLGDAAGQVYAAHGSGIGAQLVAARMLAERVAKDGARGAATFERDWHRRFGLKFLAADVFRRASTLLGPRSLGVLLGRGLLPPGLVRLGMTAGL